MIQVIAGEKGQGKTKLLIEKANEATKTTNGHLIFIDVDKAHMYDLRHDVRLVETGIFPLSNYREFIGFVYGILSQDSDITDIFVDGINKIIKSLDNEGLVKLFQKIESLSFESKINFIIGINCNTAQLPEEIKKFAI